MSADQIKTHLHEATRGAIALIVRRLQNRDPDVDDETFALECMTALLGHGWRPTAARPSPPWKQDGPPATPEIRDAVLDEYVRNADWYRRARPEGDDDDAA